MPIAIESASARLCQELTKKVRDRGLVLWVDAERQYESLVDALSRKDSGFEYSVIAFRGSYLELMLALEPFGNGFYPEKVLVHLSGLNKDSGKETPMYEMYKAGTVFEKDQHRWRSGQRVRSCTSCRTWSRRRWHGRWFWRRRRSGGTW